MRLSQAIGEFLEDLEKVEQRATGTVKAYAGDLKAFEAVVIAESANKIVAFTRDTVRLFFHKQADKGMAIETLLRRRSALNEFAKWCLRRKLLPENPMIEAPRPRRPKRAPRPFTLEERERLLALTLSPMETALRGLLYYAGLRVSEVAALRWKNVRLTSPTQRGALRVVGKGNKERIVPVLQELDAILRTWVVGEEPQRRVLEGGRVLEHKGDALRVRRIEYITAAWGAQAAVPDCVPHRFRHSCATYLFEQGMDVRLIQRILGHASIETTMAYTQVTDTAMEQGLAAMERRQEITFKVIGVPAPLPLSD
jgi:site-specific recombinase XerD